MPEQVLWTPKLIYVVKISCFDLVSLQVVFGFTVDPSGILDAAALMVIGTTMDRRMGFLRFGLVTSQ
mgnify:FL=1